MIKWLVANFDKILFVIYIILSIATFVISYIKVKKKKLSIDNLKKSINSFIKEVECFKNYSSEEKKEYVISRALDLANGLMSKDDIDAYIEEQVALTDEVNKHS